MKLKVKTVLGKVVDVEIPHAATVEEFKNLLSTSVDIPIADQKLIFADKHLRNADTLTEYGVKEGDVVVLLKIRKSDTGNKVVDATPIPTKATILQHTGGKEGKSPRARPTRTGQATGVAQLRSQLHDLMSTFMGFSPSAMESDHQSDDTSQSVPDPTQSPVQPQPTQIPPQPAQVPPRQIALDPASLQQLKDMGFPENRAKKALTLMRMNVQLAMEWLLEHGDDPNIDDPIPEEAVSRIARQETTFTPNAEAMRKLKDMGFSEEDVTQALRITNNNQEAACAWLLGDRDVESERLSFEDAAVIQTVLTNPTVQQGLGNPRVLQALKMLIENPSSAHELVNDPEVGPILMQVHNIINGNQ